MSERNVFGRGQTLGSIPVAKPGLTVPILAKDFMSTEQAVPVRVLYGSPAKVAGMMFTPVYQLSSTYHKGGSGK